MFNKKPKKEVEQESKFEIQWTQTNTNGVLSDKQWTIKYKKYEYNVDWLHHLPQKDMKELRDLLNKLCLE